MWMWRHAHAGTALASADAERTEPESPVFDEAFALDAQLILGSMVTPGTAARPPPQRQAAPLEQVPEVRGLVMSVGMLSCKGKALEALARLICRQESREAPRGQSISSCSDEGMPRSSVQAG